MLFRLLYLCHTSNSVLAPAPRHTRTDHLNFIHGFLPTPSRGCGDNPNSPNPPPHGENNPTLPAFVLSNPALAFTTLPSKRSSVRPSHTQSQPCIHNSAFKAQLCSAKLHTHTPVHFKLKCIAVLRYHFLFFCLTK